MAERKLRFWNGRIAPYRGESGFVAAYSRADAVRLINEAMGYQAVSNLETQRLLERVLGQANGRNYS